MPPLDADERATLEGWLDFHRSTLERKCAGLDDAAAATASVPPSPFTLTGLVQHLAEVERSWFRRTFAGEDVERLYGAASPDGPDEGFEVAEGTRLADALATWGREVDAARAVCAGRSLGDTGTMWGQPVSLRWVYVHLIEEYARHNGHADLVRERLDGVTGV
jgi:uncharacterized damage-inducible protein DinB